MLKESVEKVTPAGGCSGGVGGHVSLRPGGGRLGEGRGASGTDL